MIQSMSRAEQSRAEQSRAEQSRAEQSRAEQSRAVWQRFKTVFLSYIKSKSVQYVRAFYASKIEKLPCLKII